MKINTSVWLNGPCIIMDNKASHKFMQYESALESQNTKKLRNCQRLQETRGLTTEELNGTFYGDGNVPYVVFLYWVHEKYTFPKFKELYI